MTYESIIETRDGFRVKIVNDDDTQPPYNDGGSPLLRITSLTHAEQITEITSFELPASIPAAFAVFEDDVFERYLRIFHGTTSIVWWDQGQHNAHRYVTFDTADWRKAMGIEQVPGDHSLANLDEWRWYCEGEVFGVVVEKAVDRPVTVEDLLAARDDLIEPSFRAVWDRATKAIQDDDDTVWEEVDAVWGYYGHTYATEVARERLAEAIADARS